MIKGTITEDIVYIGKATPNSGEGGGGGGVAGVSSVNGRDGAVVINKSDVNLGNVDNTTDLNKPISTATQTALNNKQDVLTAGDNITIVDNVISSTGGGESGVTSVNTRTGAVVLTKDDVGLNNVDNTSDLAKPISNLTQTALETIEDRVDTLNTTKQDVLIAGDNITITDEVISANIIVPVTSVNEQIGDVVLTKADVGLNNVDNTSDLAKPISNATQTSIDTINSIINRLNTTKQNSLITGDNISLEDDVISVVNTVTSVNTRIGNVTLSKLDVGLANVDNTSDLNKPISTAVQAAINTLNSNIDQLVENVTYTDGTFTFTKEDGSTIIIDTDLERIVVSGRYDPVTESIILVLENGDEITIPVSSLIDVYTGGDTAQTQTTTTDNVITVTLRENSITESFLDSVFRQKITNIETTSNNNTTDIETLETTKQNTLTAGANITIIDDVISSVGGGGTSDYTALTNKPTINGVELSGNKTTAELLIDSYTEDEVDALLDTKVDKVEGKQLSTEDFTAEEKIKLTGLSNYDDTVLRDLIADKQDILTAGDNITIVDNVISSTGSGGTSDYTALTNKPSINGVELSGNKTTAELLIDAYTEDEVDALLNTKQNTLTAGDNITITDNVISATDTGVTDYEDLTSKPTINGVELTGNKTTAELGITLLRTAFVETLPAEGESLVLYFIPNEDDPTISDEWMWDNSGEVGKWERIGSTTIDLTPYYLKTEVDALLANKVDKVEGKELSDNNFTDAEQTKLAGLNNYDDTVVRALIDEKQDTLVSGTNIKTINGETILGEGNVVIESGKIPIDIIDIDANYTVDLTSVTENIILSILNTSITDVTITLPVDSYAETNEIVLATNVLIELNCYLRNDKWIINISGSKTLII